MIWVIGLLRRMESRKWQLIILKVCLVQPLQQNLMVFVEEIVPSISPQMNQGLLRTTTEEEVRQALFMMHPEKAAGPDGMTALFFQHSWHVIKKGISLFPNPTPILHLRRESIDSFSGAIHPSPRIRNCHSNPSWGIPSTPIITYPI